MPTPKKLTREMFIGGAKVIARSLRPHKKLLILLIAFGLINAVAQAFVPLVAGKIFDAIIAISKSNLAPLAPAFILIAIWLALQLGSNSASRWTDFNNDKLSTTVNAEYTANNIGKLFFMPLSFHTSLKQGDVNDRIQRAANWMDNIISRVLLTLLPNFLSIFIAVIITFFINGTLALVLVAAVIIYATILWQAIPGLSGLQIKMHRAWNRAYGDAYDALQNVREIKQAATEKLEQKKIRHNFMNRAAGLWLDISRIFSNLNFVQKIVVTLTQLSIFIISVFYVRAGLLTPGGLVAFNGYAAMLLGPFVVLGQNWQTIQNGMTAIMRAERILNLPLEPYEPKDAVSPKKISGDVVFENVYFTYKGGKEILRGVSFHARAGEHIAIVGDSGVGKSTIIDLILGFYAPSSGKVVVDGINIKKMALTSYRSQIGVVPQEPALFNDTVETNISYGNRTQSKSDLIRAAKDAHADVFINAFPKKYKQVVGWRGVKLSTGQKQRIALARAFMRNPSMLILDEPTSALDAQSEHLIKESLRKLMIGRTTFTIAHRLSTIREADQILVLKDGVVTEAGTHDELLSIEKGVYKNLYELQRGSAMR